MSVRSHCLHFCCSSPRCPNLYPPFIIHWLGNIALLGTLLQCHELKTWALCTHKHLVYIHVVQTQWVFLQLIPTSGSVPLNSCCEGTNSENHLFPKEQFLRSMWQLRPSPSWQSLVPPHSWLIQRGGVQVEQTPLQKSRCSTQKSCLYSIKIDCWHVYFSCKVGLTQPQVTS